LVKPIFELIDEYESEMTGFHTARAMRENARRGYLNHQPKYGFRAEYLVHGIGGRSPWRKSPKSAAYAELGISRNMSSAGLCGAARWQQRQAPTVEVEAVRQCGST
jgi:hypothetical protein